MATFRSVKLDENFHRQLKIISAKEGKTMQEIAQEALQEKYGIKPLQSPEQAAQQIIEFDDDIDLRR